MRDTVETDSAKIDTPSSRRRPTRRAVARAFMWSLPVLVAIAGIAFWLTAGRHVGTDNAYIKGDRVMVAPEVAGAIIEVLVQENQRVTRGQLLFRIQDEPFRLALARADSELETVRADVRGLRAGYRQKREEIKAAKSQETFAVADFDRQNELAQRKVVSSQRLDESRRDLDLARQRIAMLNEELMRLEAALAGNPKIHTDEHPRVKQSQAARDEAALNLRRTRVEAPIDGIAARKPTVGTHAAPGTAVMTVVADEGLWIEANFKETDLTRVRPGQTAIVHIDTYPDRAWRGTVVSIAQATGAEFAVLPPQNASGNWVKVVQRIPVRVEVRREPGDPPLRVGMSALVEIDTGHVRSLGELTTAMARALGLGGPTAAPR
ncbi:HlyD family secretion protein [Reyranella sp. CPCC 100927]|uniref:HlyD family secretion protein n=1 Tax=Reyranella sp. CPCC 100927 TaxID=2599616 RepID=UPI0011B7FD60|nr:HlyD family secretion protein [Reyranella sp. CPCC 100927]TWT02063.1 HlyD family secretion protein [Reyranella sp. CPCC 100927]